MILLATFPIWAHASKLANASLGVDFTQLNFLRPLPFIELLLILAQALLRRLPMLSMRYQSGEVSNRLKAVYCQEVHELNGATMRSLTLPSWIGVRRRSTMTRRI